MNTNNGSRFILHVSDFHLTETNVDYAKKILKKLVDKLSYEKVKVDYLIHTGDIINSSDAYIIVAKKLEIDLYLGNEIMYSNETVDLLNHKKIFIIYFAIDICYYCNFFGNFCLSIQGKIEKPLILTHTKKAPILLNVKEGILTMFFRLFYEKKKKK